MNSKPKSDSCVICYKAKAYCRCGRDSQVSYTDRSDVYLNRIDCPCGIKAVPRYAVFDKLDGQYIDNSLDSGSGSGDGSGSGSGSGDG
jgi:hypothetical protein